VFAQRRSHERRARRIAGGVAAMKGNKKVIEALNDILTAEMVGINQYFLHAKMCQNRGYVRLAAKIREESVGEMKHADEIVERILFLEGVPNLQRLGKVNIGETVSDQLQLDLAVEVDAVKRLNRAIVLCATEGDVGSRGLLETILQDEEEHLGWLETQLAIIKHVGEVRYLAEQLH
jgi:bacterioferritin